LGLEGKKRRERWKREKKNMKPDNSFFLATIFRIQAQPHPSLVYTISP
jgi:hypothetical protein